MTRKAKSDKEPKDLETDNKEIKIREKALIIRTANGYPVEAEDLNNQTKLYNKQGRFNEAELLYMQILAIHEKTICSDLSALARKLNNLAEIYKRQRKYDEVERLYMQALAILEKLLYPDHTEVTRSLDNLSFIYQAQGRYDEAVLIYNRGLAMSDKSLAPIIPIP